MCKVIADLEYKIGSECYNPNSYDGWNDIEGCDFRYPISVPDEDGNYGKFKCNISDPYWSDMITLSADSIRFMKYRFGSNELFVGRGIIEMLNYLEERYGIDFNALEKEIKKKKGD